LDVAAGYGLCHVATKLIKQENVNTINSFRRINFYVRNKKMHIEIKIQQRAVLSFCVNLSTGSAVSNGRDITQTSSAMRGIQSGRNLLPFRDLMLPWKYQVAPQRR
jgi:hypothetical protein